MPERKRDIDFDHSLHLISEGSLCLHFFVFDCEVCVSLSYDSKSNKTSSRWCSEARDMSETCMHDMGSNQPPRKRHALWIGL
jgi:hypothetical protein